VEKDLRIWDLLGIGRRAIIVFGKRDCKLGIKGNH
jgi:hypothetical protein